MATAKKTANLKADPGTASTSVAVRKPTAGAVVDIREQLKQQAAAMGERTTAPGGNKIMPGGDKQFKLPDGTKVPELQAVIVDFVTVHSFYEKPFDSKNIVPPGCFAVGGNPKAMTPVKESPNRQSEDCQICPMNEFGSQGEGKACKNGRRLALLPLNEAGDDVDHEADILILDVSPTAIRGFDGYVQGVARSFQAPPVGVITTVTMDPSVDYAKLIFSDPRPYLSISEAFARQAEAKEMLTAKPDFSGWTAVAAPKGRAAPAGKTARR